MKIINVANDTNVLCLKSKSFPDGIMDAFQELHSIIPANENRIYYGISRPENNGGIVYFAAVECNDVSEGEKFGLPVVLLKGGNYLFEEVQDYMSNIKEIGRIFNEMIINPEIDPDAYCIEVYITDKNVQCMVRLKD